MSGKVLEINLDARYEMIPILARHFLDSPSKLYGRDPHAGIDCLGVVAMAATQAGFYCPNMLIRTPDGDGKRMPMARAIETDMKRILYKDCRVGDVLFLRIKPRWDHLGIVSDINPWTMIHADPLFANRVSECKLDASIGGGIFSVLPWSKFVVAAFRFKRVNVEDVEPDRQIIVSTRRFGRKREFELHG